MRLSTAALLALLLTLAAPFGAKAANPVGPVPLSYFKLPASVVGVSHFFAGEGYGGPTPPADSYFRPQTPVEVGTYYYGVTPNVAARHSHVQGYYQVTIYKTVEAARAANAEDRDTVNDGSGQSFAPLSIARPLNDNEWLRGRHATLVPNGLYCATAGGVRYQNVRIFAFIENFETITPAGYLPCTAEDRWATRAMVGLYPKAASFVAAHPVAAAAAPTTVIRIVEPFDAAGHLLPTYNRATTTSGSCQGDSDVSARADAYRCFAGSNIMDPCFSPPAPAHPTLVACVADPRTQHATLIRLTAPLPAHFLKRLPAGQGQPWAFDLATGEQCGFEGGATLTVGDLRLNYGCLPLGAVYGNVDRSTRQWTALVWNGQQPIKPTLSQLVRVGIATAWF